jgi:hypothetical protein
MIALVDLVIHRETTEYIRDMVQLCIIDVLLNTPANKGIL